MPGAQMAGRWEGNPNQAVGQIGKSNGFGGRKTWVEIDLFAYISKFQVHKVINLEFFSVVFIRLIMMLLGNTVLSFCL